MQKTHAKCDYQGYEFGGGYLDSTCIDGQLYDADNCDDKGHLYEPLDFKFCPQCCPIDAMDQYCNDNIESLNCDSPRYTAWHLVMDIRRNRGIKTIPFWRYALHRVYYEFFYQLALHIRSGSILKPYFWSERWFLLCRWFRKDWP